MQRRKFKLKQQHGIAYSRVRPDVAQMMTESATSCGLAIQSSNTVKFSAGTEFCRRQHSIIMVRYTIRTR